MAEYFLLMLGCPVYSVEQGINTEALLTLNMDYQRGKLNSLCKRKNEKVNLHPVVVRTKDPLTLTLFNDCVLKVVRIMKRSQGRPTTAAIGDGANDVSMIQEADVGLGEKMYRYSQCNVALVTQAL